MENALLKGQRITSPGGPGEVETIGDEVVVKLDKGRPTPTLQLKWKMTAVPVN
jgi:hypothetical protein